MSYKLNISLTLGSKLVGLSISAQLVDDNGVNIGSVITSGFTEIGSGYYLWTYSNFPTNFSGGVKFMVNSSLISFVAINPQEAEYVNEPLSDISKPIAITTSSNSNVTIVSGATPKSNVSITSGVT